MQYGHDFVDNDDDGLTDERRDNDATTLLGPTEGITDMAKFLDFYNLKPEDLKDHWDADEDQDWDDGIDLNENNTYVFQADDGSWVLEPGESAGDDVGLDGADCPMISDFWPAVTFTTPFSDLYHSRLSFPVFIQPECESFLLAGFAIPANISSAFGKSFCTPA